MQLFNILYDQMGNTRKAQVSKLPISSSMIFFMVTPRSKQTSKQKRKLPVPLFKQLGPKQFSTHLKNYTYICRNIHIYLYTHTHTYININIVMAFIDDKYLPKGCAYWSLNQFFKPWNQIGWHSPFLLQVDFCPKSNRCCGVSLKTLNTLWSGGVLEVFQRCFSLQFGKYRHKNISADYPATILVSKKSTCTMA